MNTSHKEVKIRECDICPDNYMTVGNDKIGLAEFRPATINPMNGQPEHGICPKHGRSGSGEAQLLG